MSFWNILGGAALGVVAIAALPIAGPVGAVTCGLAAAGAAGTGAVAGAIKNELDEDEKNAREEEGKNKGKAEASTEINKLNDALSDAFRKLKDMDEYWNSLIAMTAVGVAVAECDGDFSENEREEISMFINGVMSNNEVPEEVKKKLEEIYKHPLQIKNAFELAKKSNVDMKIFDDIIYVVMHTDGIKKEEEVFVNAWNILKSVA
jgi:uncharacterized membrane protein YebE (DUF533 family)